MREVGSIRLNGAKARKFAETTKLLQDDVAAGFHPPGTGNFEATVAHEFGHHLKWTANERTGRRGVIDREIDSLIRRHAGLPEDGPVDAAFSKARYEAMRGVSRYAATNYDELVGEAFSEVSMNAEPRSFARELVEMLVRHAEAVESTPE